jgi:hypothetical protein
VPARYLCSATDYIGGTGMVDNFKEYFTQGAAIIAIVAAGIKLLMYFQEYRKVSVSTSKSGEVKAILACIALALLKVLDYSEEKVTEN